MSSIVKPLIDVLRPSRKENVIGNIRESGNIQASQGGNKIFNPYDKTKITNREIQTNKLDFNHLNYQNQNDGGYQVSDQQATFTQRTCTNENYYAPAGGQGNNIGGRNYDNVYRQRNNVNKNTKLDRINQGGTQTYNAYENVNIRTNECDRNNNRMWVPTNAPKIPQSSNSYGNMNTTPQEYNENTIRNRMNPDILTAFKNNPYTQSLSSVA